MNQETVFSSSQTEEIASAFRAMPVPELLAFLNTMLLHRMLVHRKVRALAMVAISDTDAQEAHLSIAAEQHDEAAILRTSIAAMQHRLDQIHAGKGRVTP